MTPRCLARKGQVSAGTILEKLATPRLPSLGEATTCCELAAAADAAVKRVSQVVRPRRSRARALGRRAQGDG